MPNYARNLTRPTQTQPIYGQNQVKNDAGGYVYELDCFAALKRFLILGCEGGTYYTTEFKMTQRAADIVLECGSTNAVRTVSLIVECVDKAIKPDASIFALALLAGQASSTNPRLREAAQLALASVNNVCRISTHLFSFVDQVTQFRGWGRALKRAVAGWYTAWKPENLGYQITKYQQRHGWAHRDVLRLAHPNDKTLSPLFDYAIYGDLTRPEVKNTLDTAVFDYLSAVELVKRTDNEKTVVDMIHGYGLVREHIPTQWLNSTKVWEALLHKMPYTAMIRNLGKMTNVGVLTPLSDATKYVCQRLADTESLKRAHVHPFSILLAKTTYAAGHGFRGGLTWRPDQHIDVYLEQAFYKAFEYVEPAGKNFMLGVDVSGSMGWRGWGHMGSIAGTNMKAYQAAAAMALVQAKTEPWCMGVAFSGGRGRSALIEIDALSTVGNLTSLLDMLKKIPVGPTDCALPILYATERNIPVDTFVIYTDCETWSGKTHPSVALEDYRQKTGRDAKLIACGMTATNYSVADPNNPNMLDIVGFDSSCPAAISEFARS